MTATKRKIALIIVLAIVLVGATIAGLIYINSPAIVTARAIKGGITDLKNRDEISPFLKTLKRGSVEFSLSNIKEDGEAINANASGKVYFSERNKAVMLSDVELKYESFKVNGEAYLSSKEFYVEENNILKGAYGAEFEDLATELSKSIFAPKSGSEYALDQEIYDKLIDILENLDEGKKMTKDAKKLAKSILKDIEKIIIDNADVESGITRERLLDGKAKVRLIHISIDSRDIEDIEIDILNYLLDSEELENFIDEYEDTLIPLFINDVKEFEREYRSL